VRRSVTWLLVACLLGLSAAPAASAEDAPAAGTGAVAPADAKAAEVFASLYAKQVRQVMASADRKDDAALAAKLLDAAREAEASPALLGLLCEKAYTLGLRHPDGHKTAVAAMELVAEKVPGQRAAALDHLVDFHQTQYNRARGADRKEKAEVLFDAVARAAAGRVETRDFAGAEALWRRALPLAKIGRPKLIESVQFAIKFAAAGRQAVQKAAALEQRLKANPDDRQARDALVKLHVTEFDDPAAAAAYLPADRSDMTSKLVTVAAMSLERLPLRACLELGDWYRSLAEETTEAGKAPMLRRARDYYWRYLELYTGQDLTRTKVKLALKQVSEALDAAPSLGALGVGRRAAASSGTVGGKPAAAMSDLALVTRPSPLPDVVSWTIETRSPRGFLSAAAFSPDSKHLATAGETGTIRLYEAAGGYLVRMMLGHNGPVYGLAFSSDGRMLASASGDRTIRLWDVATGLQVKVLEGHQDRVNAVAWSPDGKMLASAGGDKTVGLWDVASGTMTRSLTGHTSAVQSVQFTLDGKSVISGGDSVRFWDVGTGEELPAARSISGGAIAVAPDGKTVAVGHRRGVTLIDLSTLAPRWESERIYRGVSSVAFSSSGQLLAVGSMPPAIHTAASGKPVRGLDATGDAVDAITCSADGQLLAACVRELRPPTVTLRVWDGTGDSRVWDVQQVLRTLDRAAVSPDGTWLACTDGRATAVRFWNLEYGALLQALEVGGEYAPRAIAWSPTGKILATTSYGTGMRFWDVRTGRRAKTIGPPGMFYSLGWSPDGKVMATDQRRGGLELWDLAAGRRAVQVKEVDRAGPWSPDGRWLACPTARGGIAIVDGRTGRVLRVVQTASRGTSRLAWSPDGRFLAAAEGASRKAEFGSVYIYDARSWQRTASMKATEGEEGTSALAWSRDGARLSAGDTTGTIRFWDVSGKPTGEIRHRMGQVRLLAWLPDGRLLAGYGRLVRVWDVAERRPVRTFMAVGQSDGITFTDSGHFAATSGVQVERDFVYVVRGRKGIRLLNPTRMAEEHGWENHPKKVAR